MSIYATYAEMKLLVWAKDRSWSSVLFSSDSCRERWVTVIAQAVPAHIGHDGDDDYYSAFLPPRVPIDNVIPRAVVIVDEDNWQKDGQRYISPLMIMTGEEYHAIRFIELLDLIQEALDGRYG